MKKIIRQRVFESNSSSTHSFTYGSTFNDLIVADDNFVHTKLGEFGWEIEDYYDSSTKLAYILLVATDFTNHSFWYTDDIQTEFESFKETDLFKEIEAVVKECMDCDGIVFDDDSEGYIDHQSLGYNTFEDWLENTGASSIEDFIFGDIVLHTDNDNHW